MLQGVVNLPLEFYQKGGGAMMNTYEALTLLILNNTFVVALLAYIDSRNNRRK